MGLGCRSERARWTGLSVSYVLLFPMDRVFFERVIIS